MLINGNVHTVMMLMGKEHNNHWSKVYFVFIVCPVQSCRQLHSGLLWDLSSPSLALSMLGPQSLPHGLLSVSTQLACLQGSLENLSWFSGGCSQGPEPGPG